MLNSLKTVENWPMLDSNPKLPNAFSHVVNLWWRRLQKLWQHHHFYKKVKKNVFNKNLNKSSSTPSKQLKIGPCYLQTLDYVMDLVTWSIGDDVTCKNYDVIISFFKKIKKKMFFQKNIYFWKVYFLSLLRYSSLSQFRMQVFFLKTS